MTPQAITLGPLHFLADLFGRRAEPAAAAPTAEDEARAARQCIDHMLARAPDAFTSELDVQFFMHGFR